MKRVFAVAAALVALAALAAAPAEAQLAGGRVSIEPYAGYGFYGDLPEGPPLEPAVAYGGRASFALSPQWAVFGNVQRSSPRVGLGAEPTLDVDHWSAGVEFSYVPRGGAEGMLPVLLEVGLGQARYQGLGEDLAVNLGIASALQLSPGFALRYGVNDYISNYADQGVVNQLFARVGAEITL